MAGASERLTGVWHGLYTYAGEPEPVYFIATLIESGHHLSGATHESAVGQSGAPLTLHAVIEGVREDHEIAFTKRYDGTGGWFHGVTYHGMLNMERTEIEGDWSIGSAASGRFLMIRNFGINESVVRRTFAKV